MSRSRRRAGWVGAVFAGALACALVVSCARDRAPVAATRPAAETRPSAATAPADLSADPFVELTADMATAMGYGHPPAPPRNRPTERVTEMNATCVACHSASDAHTMHARGVSIACVDCHGGHADVVVDAGLLPTDPRYRALMEQAHVSPSQPGLWPTSANPVASGAATLAESADYIRFVNPGDLRAARAACYNCHAGVVLRVEKSMMAHGAMLWGAAMYNNGSIHRKDALFGESYAIDGTPQAILQTPAPSQRLMREHGVLQALFPLFRYEIAQPGNILRVFERGGARRPIVGVPDPNEVPGRPDVKLSLRGFGTDVRVDPVLIGLQKTRLLDPTLNLVGTNDHAGDYRASGCSACHVVYANDREPAHAALWAAHGNRGRSATVDPTIPRDRSGHPIQHVFVKDVPTSSCIACHIHPGTNVVNSFLGLQWWDNESDGQFMYPARQKRPTPEQEAQASRHNPEGAAPRGLWSNLYPDDVSHAGLVAGEDFLGRVSELNPRLRHMQFADFHGHGWIFRKVYRQDRRGNLLDRDGHAVAPDDPQRFDKAVHLKDIHLELGMHCVDCHFEQDVHGDGNLYGETRAAVMVECVDCHGGMSAPARMFQWLKDRRGAGADEHLRAAFTGNAARAGHAEEAIRARNRRTIADHFELRDGRLWQKSALHEAAWERARRAETPREQFEADARAANLREGWFVTQTLDTLDPAWRPDSEPGSEERAVRARYAHSIRRDGATWGRAVNADERDPSQRLAHGESDVSCYACHTSWNTSCFGCHLPMRANQHKPMLHNEGLTTRNYTNYNFQTLRDDIYMLGRDSTVKGGKVVPVRSACAVLVSSQDQNRQWVYAQQQTISAEGNSGQAFSPYFPHTVRSTETKQCTDCHLSADGDNNAIMAQLLLQGTNAVNFIGRYAWVAAGEGGLAAVAVTEHDEPQAVIGSTLHALAYPDDHRAHLERGMRLTEAHTHERLSVLDVQLRGEYLYAACGSAGFRAFDVANIDNKAFSERIVTAPVSPLGQQLHVPSSYATSVYSPSTMALDPTRPQAPVNEEQPIHLLYAFLYVTDRDEGLIVVGNPLSETRRRPGVATLLDGDPTNNFIRRAATFNPDGLLRGARHMALLGHYAYVSCDAGLAVVDLDDPLKPRLVTTLSSELANPRRVAFQFRYGFVCDDEGVKVIDVTDPRRPRVVASVAIEDARDVYLCRTFGYVAAGTQGLVILDLERPERPRIDQVFDASGAMNDATAVRVGMTNTSLFAYVADGVNGLRVVQLTSPDDTPGYLGFSPRPTPRLVAWHRTPGPAIGLSEGLDRDRAIDESGHKLAVFGRRGSRPLSLEEQQRMYLREQGGVFTPWTVRDLPTTEPLPPPAAAPTEPAPEPTRRGPRRPGRG